MKVDTFLPVYVDFIPLNIEEGKLYVSMRFGTAVHLCPCGCKTKIVTPIRSGGWTMRFNGKISLSPSIGNYEIDCQSHYFITENQVKWVTSKAVYESNKRPKSKRKKLKFKKKFPYFFFV